MVADVEDPAAGRGERTAVAGVGAGQHHEARAEPADEPLGVERVVATKTAVLAFNGRADRIDSRAGEQGPEAVIVDYKTGRSGLDADDARGSQALALYAYAAQRVFRRPCHRVELHHLPTGGVAGREHTAATLHRQLQRADSLAAGLGELDERVGPETSRAEADELFPARVGSRCGWCDFHSSCRPGQAVPRQQPWAGVED